MRLQQPDPTSCGPTCLAYARAGTDPAYEEALQRQPATQIGREHARLASWHRPGGLQVPWPRCLGTSPWSLATALEGLTGLRYSTTVLPRDPIAAYDLAHSLVDAVGPAPVALYVGSRWLPRHVTLVVGVDTDSMQDAFCLFEPAAGVILHIRRHEVAADPTIAGWPRWWMCVAPDRT